MAASRQGVPGLSLWYHASTVFFQKQCKVPPDLIPHKREESSEKPELKYTASLKHCITLSKTHLNEIMDIYLVYLQKTHKNHQSKKPMNKKTSTNKAIALAFKYNLYFIVLHI